MCRFVSCLGEVDRSIATHTIRDDLELLETNVYKHFRFRGVREENNVICSEN